MVVVPVPSQVKFTPLTPPIVEELAAFTPKLLIARSFRLFVTIRAVEEWL